MVKQKEKQRIVEEFARSGMTRRQYCAKHKLALSTLDCWRRTSKQPKPPLVEVAVEAPSNPGFALVLSNGRHIESSWRFDEARLARLIRTCMSAVGAVDNYATHKVAKVNAWLLRHPGYHVHFTPTSASWLNLVERLFAEVTEKCVRRGSHTSVPKLEKALLDYLDRRSEHPKPFSWTADADLILGKIQRFLSGFLTQDTRKDRLNSPE
jgi:hypothetical protein